MLESQGSAQPWLHNPQTICMGLQCMGLALHFFMALLAHWLREFRTFKHQCQQWPLVWQALGCCHPVNRLNFSDCMLPDCHPVSLAAQVLIKLALMHMAVQTSLLQICSWRGIILDTILGN